MLSARFVSSMTRLTTSSSAGAMQQATRTCAVMPQHHDHYHHVGGLIEEKIQRNKVMIFSKSTCPFCTKAKKVFNDLIEKNHLKPHEVEIMEIEADQHCNLIQDHLHKMTGAKSVPRVFVNQQFVGGGDEVTSAYIKGDLHKMLA